MARGLIARAWLGGADVEARLGRFALRRSQREAVARVHAAFREFGGALVVEPPGAGKTVLALAVARDLARSSPADGSGDGQPALVVAPATLKAQWHRSAERAGIPIAFASLESLSRGRMPSPAPLLIVDEAHHARTPGTVRYGMLESLAANANVLLLTATPVVNRRDDRTALLALFLGPRAASIPPASLARCVLRHEADVLGAPPVRRLAPLRVRTAVAGLAEGLQHLPAPFTLAGDDGALVLIRLSLALAWCSSLAALDRALARRVQRGEAIRDLLVAGRTPSKAALRLWCHDDSATQLAFSGLLAPPLEETSVPAAAHATLVRHLAAVRGMRALIGPEVEADARRRAAAILRVARRHPSRRVVVFARHAATIEALGHAMRGAPGVVTISGRGVRAAAGRWSRDEVLASVGPRAPTLSAHDARAVRILLATDLLAEGIELSGIGIIVHADLPWTPARIRQRRGRVARPGGGGQPVIETMLASPPEASRIIRLARRLRRKRRVGAAATRDASVRAELAAMLRRWSAFNDRRRVTRITAAVEGFLAAVRVGSAVTLIGAIRDGKTGRWRVFDDARRLLALVSTTRGAERAADARAAIRARRLLTRRLARGHARMLIGDEPARPGDGAWRAMRRIEACLARARPLERATIADLARRFALVANAAGGFRVAAEAGALARARLGDRDFLNDLSALVPSGPSGPDAEPASARIVALLLLTPAAPRASAAPPADGPPSASPGTAAPR